MTLSVRALALSRSATVALSGAAPAQPSAPGTTQLPVPPSHTRHGSHATGGPAWHAPDRQVSPVEQPFPSSQLVPSRARGCVHSPAPLHTSDLQAFSSAG